MGWNSKAKKAASGGTSVSVSSLFKGSSNSHSNSNRRSSMRRGAWEDQGGDDQYARAPKVWTSAEDDANRGRWVAKPGIDIEAEKYINKINAARASDPWLQVFDHRRPS